MDYDRVEISLFSVVRFTDRSILLWIHLDRKNRSIIADLVGLIICELIAFLYSSMYRDFVVMRKELFSSSRFFFNAVNGLL